MDHPCVVNREMDHPCVVDRDMVRRCVVDRDMDHPSVVNRDIDDPCVALHCQEDLGVVEDYYWYQLSSCLMFVADNFRTNYTALTVHHNT